MEWIFPVIALTLFLACVIGALYFFYRAVRFFISKRFGRGLLSLVPSLLLGFIVFSVIQAVSVANLWRYLTAPQRNQPPIPEQVASCS